MDLGIEGRAVWLMSHDAEVCRRLADAAREEGARAVVFGAGAKAAIRPLRVKFGLQVLALETFSGGDGMRRAISSAINWGGPPCGLIMHVKGPGPLAIDQSDARAFCSQVGQDSAIVILREADNFQVDELQFTRALEMDLVVAATLANGQTRVSIVGVLPNPPLTARTPTSRLGEPACAALVLFLIGRGGPQLTLIGRDGFIQTAPRGER